MDFQTRYEFNPKTDLLGKGGFSRVYKANDILLDRTVALKFFTGNDSEKKYQILNEIKKVIKFEHPNLCKYYDVAVLNTRNVMGETENIEVGIMEYLDAGNIKTYLKNHPEHTDKLLTDVLRGLAYLHRKGIVHRDLKPQNIIIKMDDDEPVAKITDFGISKLISSDDNNSSALIGTIEYMAPEQFNPKKYGIGGKITTNLDLWSFGLLVYEALQYKPLFGSRSTGTSAEQVMRNILSDSYLSKANSLPPKYLAIVKRCLVKYASKRAQNALELIPLFNETVFIPADADSDSLLPPDNEIDHNKKDPGALEESVISDQRNMETSLKPGEDMIRAVDVDLDITGENTSLLDAAEADEDEQTQLVHNASPFTPDATRDAITNDLKLTEDPPQLHHLDDEVLPEQLNAREPTWQGILETTQVENNDNATGEHTQILQFQDEVASQSAQLDALEEQTENGNETEVIHLLEKVQDNNGGLIAEPTRVPGKEQFQILHTKREKFLLLFQSLADRAKLLAFKRYQPGKLLLYSTIPILAIIGFFVFSKLNSGSNKKKASDSTRLGPVKPVVEKAPVFTDMIFVRGGNFIMGEADELGTAADSLAHMVNISKLLIGKYEVTVDEFRQFINDSNYLTTAEMLDSSYIYKNGKMIQAPHVNWRYDFSGNLHDSLVRGIPVVHVSWDDANAYCQWLSRRNKKHYRLPTAAEWEFAANGGDSSKKFIYSGSNNLADVAWFQGNSGNKLQKVGQKQPNELQIFDMTGNVMEWCMDILEENKPTSNTAGSLPATRDSSSRRIAKGGSWFVGERTWFRNSFKKLGFTQNSRGGQLGFRICEDFK